MATNQQKFFDQVDKGTTGFIERLAEAVRIPSVSSDPAHENDVKAMDAWLKEKLHSLGVSIDSPPSEVPSLVLGRIKGIEGSTKTVLVYGHYDVQPADAKGWASQNADSPNPFSPTRIVKGDTDKLVGRGTTDDKGPVTGWLNVLEAHKKLGLKLPVNIQFLFEGTEEVGNDAFEPWITAEAKKPNGFFAGVDCVCITDNYWFNSRHPTLSYGLRGIAIFSLEITGATNDLHSGIYGRMIHEPLTDLIKLLGKLVGTNGVITVPGVEELVPPPTEEEKQEYRALDYTVEDLAKDTGAHVELSDDPAQLLMGRMRYPSLSIHGIDGGREGTIIPRQVTGRFSIRLVTPQAPEVVSNLVEDYLYKEFDKLRSRNTIKVISGFGALPWIGDKNHWNFKAAYEATKSVYGNELAPYYTLEGGTIPLVFTLQNELKGKPNVLLLPMGRSDDGAHSLSEKVDILNYIGGTKVYGAYLYEVAKQSQTA
jgi:Cys-Gly metallodipeptidase DUG1